MPPARSVFESQKPVFKLQHEIYETEQRLARMKARLEMTIERHRVQIQASLSSENPEERAAAEGVAVYWGVLPPPHPETPNLSFARTRNADSP